MMAELGSCYFGAVRLSCSGQMSETWALLRACLENSLYAFYIAQNPELAEVWMKRHDSAKRKKKCKTVFAVGAIWKALEKKSWSVAEEAKSLYETSIDFGAHPNERSVIPNLQEKEDGSGYSLRILNPDEASMRASMSTTILTASCVFRIFALIFPDEFKQPNLAVKISNLNSQMKPLALQASARLKAAVKS
jgi:hypothetical protein